MRRTPLPACAPLRPWDTGPRWCTPASGAGAGGGLSSSQCVPPAPGKAGACVCTSPQTTCSPASPPPASRQAALTSSSGRWSMALMIWGTYSFTRPLRHRAGGSGRQGVGGQQGSWGRLFLRHARQPSHPPPKAPRPHRRASLALQAESALRADGLVDGRHLRGGARQQGRACARQVRGARGGGGGVQGSRRSRRGGGVQVLVDAQRVLRPGCDAKDQPCPPVLWRTCVGNGGAAAGAGGCRLHARDGDLVHVELPVSLARDGRPAGTAAPPTPQPQMVRPKPGRHSTLHRHFQHP